jgi:hypothetical protein
MISNVTASAASLATCGDVQLSAPNAVRAALFPPQSPSHIRKRCRRALAAAGDDNGPLEGSGKYEGVSVKVFFRACVKGNENSRRETRRHERRRRNKQTLPIRET